MAVYKRLPYFMKMLFKLAPVERPGCGAFFVDDKLRVHYDPEMAAKWGVEYCATFLAHEVQHPLREHLKRGAAFYDREAGRFDALKPYLAQLHPMLGVSVEFLWNVVADCEINPSIDEVGLTFPDGFAPVYPKTFNLKNGDFAESYADELFARAEKLKKDDEAKQPPPPQKKPTSQPKSDDGDGQSNDGEESTTGGDSGDDEKKNDEKDDAANESPAQGGGGQQKSESPKPFEGCCGSCAGNRHELEDSADEESMPNGVGEVEVEIARRQVAHDTAEPTEEMKRLMGQFGIGKVPGSLANWAKAQLAAPEVPWQKVLAPLVRNAVAYARGRVDWKFGRPSRRREAMKQSLGESARGADGFGSTGR
jgi:hypothetical protein